MSFLLDMFRSTVFYAPRRCRALWLLAAGSILVIISAFGIVSTAWAHPPAERPGRLLAQGTAGGKEIFEQKCQGCHSIGGGKLVGPDLKDITQRRETQWIKDFILDPQKMLATDPTAQQLLKENNNIAMPNLGLPADQVDLLVEYLSNPGAAPTAPAAAGPTGLGDPLAGQRLFTGELALTSGGPHCLACHSVSGTGSLGGGALGPDLTHVAQRYGEPGLSAALQTIAFPTMLGPFQNRPLTAQEQADLVAFFMQADRMQPPVPVITAGALTPHALLVLGISLAGAGLFFALLAFFWVRIKKNQTRRLPVRKV